VVFPEHPYELLSTSFSIRLENAWMRVVFLFLTGQKVLYVSDLLATVLGAGSWESFLRTASGINADRTDVKYET